LSDHRAHRILFGCVFATLFVDVARDADRSTHSWGGGRGDDDLIAARNRLDDASKPTGGHGEVWYDDAVCDGRRTRFDDGTGRRTRETMRFVCVLHARTATTRVD